MNDCAVALSAQEGPSKEFAKTPAMLITFPALYGIDYFLKGNPVRQIAVERSQRDGVLAPFRRGKLSGFVFQPGVADEEVLIVPPEAKRLCRGGMFTTNSTAHTCGIPGATPTKY
jgi:hypothetical protein